MITFTVNSRPVAKARARKGKYGYYTPGKTTDFEALVAKEAAVAMEGVDPLEGGLKAIIWAQFTPAKSWSKKKKQAALDGELKHTSRPDVDNIGKAVLDGMNKIVYNDDASIDHLEIRKSYGLEDAVSVFVEAA
jgi:Holliday junction resolvase RusA-like endonuclease